MRVLVTDGNSRAALAITRSLGAASHTVLVGSKTSRSIAARSRFCSESFTYTDPTADSSAFVADLLKKVTDDGIDLVLPVSDVCLLPVAASRKRFEAHCAFPFAPTPALENAADKQRIMSLAGELGVATPRSQSLASPDDLGEQLQFPVVIKPARSRVRSNAGWIATGVDYADDREQLEAKLADLPLAAYPVLLQERICGPGIGQFYCFDRGKPVAAFAHRRLREKPPSGGVSVLRESVALHPVADEFSRRLLQALNWHGVAMVEFKLDKRDNEPKLMEINGRFWGSLQLAIDAGVDFPRILAEIAAGQSIDPVLDYRLGVRSRWLWGDIDLLLMYLLKSRSDLALPAAHESRAIAILKILLPWVPGQRTEVLRLSDPRPWFQESINWFHN